MRTLKPKNLKKNKKPKKPKNLKSILKNLRFLPALGIVDNKALTVEKYGKSFVMQDFKYVHNSAHVNFAHNEVLKILKIIRCK